MDEQEQILQQIRTTTNNQNKDLVTLADLQSKKLKVVREEEQNVAAKVRLANFSSADSVIQSERLYTYYCSICGKYILSINVELVKLPQRKTDKTLAINTKEFFIKHYMTPDKESPIYIQRENGLEVQYRWNCPECNISIGYQCAKYEENFNLIIDQKFEKKPFVYVYDDSLVKFSEDCIIFLEILREQQVSQLQEDVQNQLKNEEYTQNQKNYKN